MRFKIVLSILCCPFYVFCVNHQQNIALECGLLCLRMEQPKRANDYFKEALSYGKHAVAMKALADGYLSGDGIQKNPTKALILYVESADLGYGPAQLSLGFILLFKEAWVFNPNLAMSYFEKAARNSTLESPQRDIAKKMLSMFNKTP